MIATFEESSVTQFFDRFKKIAAGNNWPKERWSVLTQNVLEGKCLTAFDLPSFVELNYDTL